MREREQMRLDSEAFTVSRRADEHNRVYFVDEVLGGFHLEDYKEAFMVVVVVISCTEDVQFRG